MILLAGSSSQHKNRCVEKFKQSNFEVFVFDNPSSTGLPLWSNRDNGAFSDEIWKMFRKNCFDTVVYFLAFPCEEYRADIWNAINLLNAMVKYGVKNFENGVEFWFELDAETSGCLPDGDKESGETGERA